jgi:uncharacterized protein (TIGR02466 family)
MDLVILWVTNCVTDGGLVESFVRRRGVRGNVSVGAVGHTLGMVSTRELLRAGMWISGARSVVAAALVAAFVTAGSLPDGDSGGRHLWRTPVWCVDHAVSSQEMQGLKRLMGKEKKRNPRTQVISNIGGYQSNVDWIHREGHAEDIKRLHNTILRQTAEFLHAWEVSGEAGTHGGGGSGNLPFYEVWLDGGWINVNKHLDFNMPHVHPQSYISGTVYLPTRRSKDGQKKPDSGGEARLGNLTFEDPRDFSGSEHIQFEPLPGRLLLWPAWLGHSVAPNPSNKKRRYSISFNVQVSFMEHEGRRTFPDESLFCRRQNAGVTCEFPDSQGGKKFLMPWRRKPQPFLRLLWPSTYSRMQFFPPLGAGSIGSVGPPLAAAIEDQFGLTLRTLKRHAFEIDSAKMLSFSTDRQADEQTVIVVLQGKSQIKLKDPRKMCSFGFQYTMGCPEDVAKNHVLDMAANDSVIFPSALHYIIPPNKAGQEDLVFVVGAAAQRLHHGAGVGGVRDEL